RGAGFRLVSVGRHINFSLASTATEDSAPLPAAGRSAINPFFDSCEFRQRKGPPMGARRIRREQRQVDMATSRIVNGHKKKKERVRRDSRMLELVKANKLPYTPTILSWLSVQLDKPSTRITQDDVN